MPENAPAPGTCCEWFALCDRDAVRYRTHPILPPVPICARCDDKVEQL